MEPISPELALIDSALARAHAASTVFVQPAPRRTLPLGKAPERRDSWPMRVTRSAFFVSLFANGLLLAIVVLPAGSRPTLAATPPSTVTVTETLAAQPSATPAGRPETARERTTPAVLRSRTATTRARAHETPASPPALPAADHTVELEVLAILAGRPASALPGRLRGTAATSLRTHCVRQSGGVFACRVETGSRGAEARLIYRRGAGSSAGIRWIR